MRCRVSTCGGTVSQNSTHIQNPGYPSGYTTSTTCSYTLSKSSSDICSFRLDFVAFVITATTTTSSTSTNNACNYDTVGLGDCICISLHILIFLQLSITVPSQNNPPTICGYNTGQHIYLEGSPTNSAPVVAFTITGQSSFERSWQIRVDQIPCGTTYSPPVGCLQVRPEVNNC